MLSCQDINEKVELKSQKPTRKRAHEVVVMVVLYEESKVSFFFPYCLHGFSNGKESTLAE